MRCTSKSKKQGRRTMMPEGAVEPEKQEIRRSEVGGQVKSPLEMFGRAASNALQREAIMEAKQKKNHVI